MKKIAKQASPSASLLILTSIFVNILWGIPFPLVKVMYHEMDFIPNLLGSKYNGQVLIAISIRFILAGIITLVIAMFRKENIFVIKKKLWVDITVMGLVSTTAAYFFFTIGLVHTMTIKSSIFAQSSIFFSILLAHFFYKNDKINCAKSIGLFVGFAGLLIINIANTKVDINDLFNVSLLGDGFMLLYGLVAAIGMMQAKTIGHRLPVFVMTGWNLFIGGVMLFVVGMIMGGQFELISWTVWSTILMVFLALLSSVTFGLWYWVVQYAKIGEVSMFKFCMPISGSFIAVAIQQDKFTVPLSIGLVFVCLGIIIVNKPAILGIHKKSTNDKRNSIK